MYYAKLKLMVKREEERLRDSQAIGETYSETGRQRGRQHRDRKRRQTDRHRGKQTLIMCLRGKVELYVF